MWCQDHLHRDGFFNMTGPSSNNSKSIRYSRSECTDYKVPDIEWFDKEKRDNYEQDSDKSDATYTKSNPKFPLQYPIQKNYSGFSGKKPTSRARARTPQRIYSKSGVLEPSFEASKRAQWLTWNDPAFKRRRSFDHHKLRQQTRADPLQDHKTTLTTFKRSLQLLGIKYTDLGLEDPNCKNNNKNPRGRVTPTFSTQLRQRSVSLTNLRNAVLESGLPAFEAVDKLHRDILSRAVYEEWYFRKQTENKVRKELEEEFLKKRQEELEWMKLERRRRAEENFEKWKKNKAYQKKDQGKEGNTKIKKVSPSFAKIRPCSEGAFESWKAKKDEEGKVQSSIRKQIEEEFKKKNEEKEKREAAEAAFKAWKQRVDEELRNKSKEREKHLEIVKGKKEIELKKKKEEAEMSFKEWKKKKDNEIKQKLKNARHEAKKLAEEKGMKLAERQYDAANAFELWLDKVDERMEKDKFKIQDKENPPWYPG